jgi:hypothetical protein
VLCAVTAVSVTAAAWPAPSPAAFTNKATTADLAIVTHQQQVGAALAVEADSAADIRSAKTAAASQIHEIQLAQMRATAARRHAAHLAVLAKRAEQARQAEAAAAAAKAAAVRRAEAAGVAAKAAAVRRAEAAGVAAKAAAVRRAEAAGVAAKAAAVRRAAARQQATSSSPKSSPSRSSSSSHSAPSGSPRQIAQRILASEGRSGQFSCLDSLWVQESGWNVHAQNPGSGAYGIPQSLPGSKMASAGPDWRTSAATQIRWGLSYIDSVYGSPCAAWSHEQSTGWY